MEKKKKKIDKKIDKKKAEVAEAKNKVVSCGSGKEREIISISPFPMDAKQAYTWKLQTFQNSCNRVKKAR